MSGMQRALVLGGGGLIGVAWESGLVTGLREAGVALAGFDAIVGTSAGAMVGAQVGSGRVPLHPDARRARCAAEQREDALTRLPIDREQLDPGAIGRIFMLWSQMVEPSRETVVEIGQIARGLYRAREADVIAAIAAAIEVPDWPAQRLLVAAVDTATGARRIFERGDGVALGRAVSASSVVPGLLPSVEIDGRLYMDGQVHSSTNADALLADAPAQVVIAMATNALTSPGIGRHAERMLELESAALRAKGCELRVITPVAADIARIGSDLLDGTRVADAYAVGLETGRAVAPELR